MCPWNRINESSAETLIWGGDFNGAHTTAPLVYFCQLLETRYLTATRSPLNLPHSPTESCARLVLETMTISREDTAARTARERDEQFIDVADGVLKAQLHDLQGQDRRKSLCTASEYEHHRLPERRDLPYTTTQHACIELSICDAGPGHQRRCALRRLRVPAVFCTTRGFSAAFVVDDWAVVAAHSAAHAVAAAAAIRCPTTG